MVLECNAAPSVPADPSQAPEPAELAPLGGNAGRASNGDARSVELLLQMQQRNAGISFNERVRPANGGLRSAVVTPAIAEPVRAAESPAAVPTAPSGLFGSSATPMVTAQRNATVSAGAPTTAGSVMVGADTRGTAPSTGYAVEPPSWLLLPRDIIEYIRDNRATVVASVLALVALFWAVSLLFSRQRS